MITADQRTKALLLRALHAKGILVLPNAWDAGRATMVAAGTYDSLDGADPFGDVNGAFTGR